VFALVLKSIFQPVKNLATCADTVGENKIEKEMNHEEHAPLSLFFVFFVSFVVHFFFLHPHRWQNFVKRKEAQKTLLFFCASLRMSDATWST
jgi:hypothetical protein